MSNKISYASLWLSAVCILFFALQMAFGTELFLLNTAVVWQQPWRLITAVFSHGSIPHLLSNIFALSLFGLILEGRIGSKKVLWIFLLSGITINFFIASFGFYKNSLGASGAIFAILGILIILRPRMTVWIYNMPLPMFLAGIIWALQDTLGVFFPSGTGNIAHLSGLAIGLTLGIYWRKKYGDKKKEKKGKDTQLDKDIDDWEKRFMKG